MPIYSYRCQACGNEFDVRQSFTDDALTVCEACGGELRKLLGNVGVVFKGSGWYSTDVNKTSKAAGRPTASSESSAPAGGDGSGPVEATPGVTRESSSSSGSGGATSSASSGDASSSGSPAPSRSSTTSSASSA